MTGSPPGLHVVDHLVDVPLDWSGEDDGRIEVFAREVVAAHRRHEDLPLLLLLQGGPGGAAPRPADASGWLGHLLQRFRVVLLDQRGTGRSTPVDAARVTAWGEAAGDRLAHFRADAIVRDAEHLRHTVFGGRRWTTLGQSYGGFVTLTYLSLHPEALDACLITGGLPSLEPSAAEVYRRTVPSMLAASGRFHRMHPQDAAVIARIADLLDAEDVRLPDGDRLTVRRLQLLGGDLGMQHGAQRLHALFDLALSTDGERLTDRFLHRVQARTAYAANPLYAVLQESIYGAATPTGWAAARELERHPALAPDARPLGFLGEAMAPWMFEEIRLLRPFARAAEALARRSGWPAPYDLDRLRSNEVPVVAAVYADDLYVPRDLSLATAETVGATRWVTDEWQHDGLRVSGTAVVERLLRMLDERDRSAQISQIGGAYGLRQPSRSRVTARS